ncbi:GntR family transcriptional regulator [Paenibacillus sp. IB182496]|uniref:GntR family transcriptional regulator n=1 Tax=Paenibacillus sabuli TaxID=2772509 RepID=A0A927GPT5_9BACL|nr:GntR family transcriptional regulator [Paenibacillus sabuli]MBD2843809.1 GntR family transcriptional regulator [Paenibacillus sabuli]
MASLRVRTVTNEVYRQIKSDILSGVYRPGERLMEMEIADKLEVSRTPVRDAMIRLEQEGLATIEPRRGIYVRKLSKKDIQNYYELQSALEGLAAQLTAQKRTERDIARFQDLLLQMKACISDPTVDNLQAMIKLNRDFHDLLYTIADNPLLTKTQSTLENPITLIRSIFPLNTVRIHAVYDEHERLVQSIAAGDAAEAKRYAEYHVLRSWKSAEADLEETLD